MKQSHREHSVMETCHLFSSLDIPGDAVKSQISSTETENLNLWAAGTEECVSGEHEMQLCMLDKQ